LAAARARNVVSVGASRMIRGCELVVGLTTLIVAVALFVES